MKPSILRAKIVAEIGAASDSPEMIREMLLVGMNVAQLNFSHGNYDDRVTLIKCLRDTSEELNLPKPVRSENGVFNDAITQQPLL
ncbi:hypothetical protein PseudUWO311_23760 [Pseudanabaena sp. UWO311]|nr:hypothetical protein PseudUWO311_23760 [Pseudanabaena sp. UWO311]